MTLQTEIEARGDAQSVGFFVDFDGIETRLSTHAFTDGATYIARLTSAPNGAGQTLDRQQGVVKPGGFSIAAHETTANALGAFFARRGGTTGPLVEGISASATTIKVLDSDFADGSTVYLGQETITLGTYATSPARYTGCTRGAHGSEAIAHQVSSEISNRPRFWLGRRATLYEVNLATGTSAAIRSGLISGSPQFSQGEWTVDTIDLSTVLARPISTGWNEEPILDIATTWDTVIFSVADADLFGGDDDVVRVTTGDGVIFYEISATDNASTPNTITVWKNSSKSGGTLLALTDDLDLGKASIRQVAVIDAPPALAALQVLLSQLGDGTNDATHDALIGIAPTGGDGTQARKLTGAGIPASYIDTASWEDASRGEVGRFVIDESMSALDFLWREILWRLGGFVFINGEGKIAFKRYDPGTVDSSLDVYTETDLASTDIHVVDDEKEVIGGAEIECNWDPADRKYKHKTTLVFAETQEIYGTKANFLKLSSRSLRIGGVDPANLASNPVSEAILTSLFLRQHARTRLGLVRIRVAFKWRHHLRLFVGYRFKLTLATPPNGEGTVGFTSTICEVVSLAPENNTGRVVVECEVMPTGKIVAPALKVVAISGLQIIGDSGDKLAPMPVGIQAPLFPVGSEVRIFDASSTPPFSVSEVQRVTACGNVATVTVNALPSSFTLAAGDVLKLIWTADTGFPNGIGADVNDHAMVADASDEVDGERSLATRWG